MGLFSSIGKAFGGAVGSLFNGPGAISPASALGLAGTLFTNKTNKDIANDTNSTAIQLANTQYQRAVTDLRAAGLNPILATKLGGAAVPPLHVPQFNNPINSAFAAQKTVSETENLDAKTELTKTQEILASNLVPGSEAIATVTQQLSNLVNAVVGEIGQSRSGYTSLLKNAQGLFSQGLQKIDELGGNAADAYNQIKQKVGNKINHFKKIHRESRPKIQITK